MFIRKLFVTVVVFIGMLVSAQLAARDFVALQQDIGNYAKTVAAIETSSGRYDLALIEPLHGLARAQLAANLFTDAAESIDRAIQVARISEGLYAPLQYPLLQTEIDIALTLDNWEAVNEKLDHFTWLLSQQYAGATSPRISLARWIADVHLQGYDEDIKDRRASHLIAVTYLKETLVQYAQIMRMTEQPVYLELLFELAGAYRAEVAAIRAGGSTSYELRRVFPGVDIIEDRKVAVEKRYRVGLEKLEMLRDQVIAGGDLDARTAAVIQLYFADWHGYFRYRRSQRAALDRAVDELQQAQVQAAEIDAYLSRVGELSWQQLQLDFTPMEHHAVVAGD